jgi:hypothetical protein
MLATMPTTSEDRTAEHEQALMDIIDAARSWKAYMEAPYRRPVKAVAELDRVVMFFLYKNARAAAEGLGLTDRQFQMVLSMPPLWRAS